MKRYNGDTRDVCTFRENNLASSRHPRKQNHDVPEQEDEDVMEERKKVERLMSGEQEEKVSLEEEGVATCRGVVIFSFRQVRDLFYPQIQLG